MTGAVGFALVPWAMATFGTVVPGVGTIHASLAAGGVAATLQATSSVQLSGPSAVVGASLGALVHQAEQQRQQIKNN